MGGSVTYTTYNYYSFYTRFDISSLKNYTITSANLYIPTSSVMSSYSITEISDFGTLDINDRNLSTVSSLGIMTLTNGGTTTIRNGYPSNAYWQKAFNADGLKKRIVIKKNISNAYYPIKINDSGIGLSNVYTNSTNGFPYLDIQGYNTFTQNAPIVNDDKSITVSWTNGGGLVSGDKYRIYYAEDPSSTYLVDDIINTGNFVEAAPTSTTAVIPYTKDTTYSIAVVEVQNAASYEPIPSGLAVRYVRDWINGNSVNNGNHWVEVKVFDTNGTNLALGKWVTEKNGTMVNISKAVDGDLTAANYFTSADTLSYIQIDLAQGYSNIDHVTSWHYYTDGRKYNDTKVEVSADGVTWYSLFDSDIDGKYVETSAGHTAYMNRATKSISGYNGARSNIQNIAVKAPTPANAIMRFYPNGNLDITGTLRIGQSFGFTPTGDLNVNTLTENAPITSIYSVDSLGNMQLKGALAQQVTISTGNTSTVIQPPASLALISTTESTATVSWASNTETNLAGYNIYIGTTKQNTSIITNTSYTINNLSPSTSYNIGLTAVNTQGQESQKTVITVTTSAHVPTVIVSDSFNRANNTTSLGNADTGQTWQYSAINNATVPPLSIGINNNSAYNSVTQDILAIIDAGISDCIVSMRISTLGAYEKLIWRFKDYSNFYWAEDSGANLLVFVMVNGTRTQLGSLSRPVAGQTLKVVLNGGTHQVYLDNALVQTISDSSVVGTKHGMGFYDTTARLDDFKVTAL